MKNTLFQIFFCFLLFESVFTGGCTSSVISGNGSATPSLPSVTATYTTVRIVTFLPRTPYPETTWERPYRPEFVIINPINRVYYSGDIFEINGTTNLSPSEKLKIDIFERIHSTPSDYHYTTKGINEYVPIKPGKDGVNTWSITVNSDGYPQRFYEVDLYMVDLNDKRVDLNDKNFSVNNQTDFYICDDISLKDACEISSKDSYFR